MEKNQMRKMIKNKLMDMSEESYEQLSNVIHTYLFTLTNWEKAETIALTISRGREVEMSRVIKRAWDHNKRVVVPKCYPDTKTMEFRQIDTFQQLEQVYFGLKEPILSKTKPAKREDIDLMIVPGICFDKEGFRIGYGGGYYDRYLKKYKGHTLSLAFSFQVLDKIPRENHDIPVHEVITENRVIL